MGMFDKPVYLTGDDGYVTPGDTFFIWNAKLDGSVNVGGTDKPQVKLLVSRELDGERTVVHTAGAGIVNQINRMDATDAKLMRDGGMEVRLDEVPSKQGSPTRVLTPADEGPPSNGVQPSLGGGPDF